MAGIAAPVTPLAMDSREGVAPVAPDNALPAKDEDGDHEGAVAPRVVPHRLVLASIFLVYVLTRYPDVGGRINMGDSAKFQFLARTLGIGHSPGNPLYLMLSALWVRIPLPLADSTKMTLLSGVFAIVTVILLSRAVGLLGVPPVLRRPFVLETKSFAAILLGLGSLFWTLATEAEVYTLGTVFIAGTVLGTIGWTKREDRRSLLLAIGCLGFGMANHLTIAALGPGLLVVLLRDARGREALRSVRLWAVALGALALAVLAYGWIAWRLTKAPLVYSEFPKTIDTQTFLAFVTARGVVAGTYSKTTYAGAVFERLPDLFAHLQQQWAWPLLLCLPFGAIRLARLDRALAIFLSMGVLGHLVLAFVFRIPDPEGLFTSVAVLVTVPLALVPASVEADLTPAGRVVTGPRAFVVMVLVHGALIAAHLERWRTDLYTAYVQQTPEGRVVLNLPTLADVVPDGAKVAVPCGHYGCVEVVSYYRFADPALREKRVTFVRFPWSEWDEGTSSVPLVADPRARRERPLCVLLQQDVAKLNELGLKPEAIARPPARVLGRSFVSGPLHCLR